MQICAFIPEIQTIKRNEAIYLEDLLANFKIETLKIKSIFNTALAILS